MVDEILDTASTIVVPVGIGVYRKPKVKTIGRRPFAGLREVARDLSRFSTLFKSSAYRDAGFQVIAPIKGTYTTVRRQLLEVVGKVHARPGRKLIVLWSGHAELVGNQDLRLATSDSLTPMSSADGWAPTELINLLTTARVQGLYLMLDVCQAGHALGSVAEQAASRMRDEPPPRDQLPGFAALCSAQPYERAKDGLFAQVLLGVLEAGPSAEAKQLIAQKGYGGFTFNRLLTPSELASVMEAEFEVRVRNDPAVQLPTQATVGGQFPVFLNPLREVSPQPRRMDELRGFVSALDARSHFLPKARGLEPGEPGWNFTGRVHASKMLADFIRGKSLPNLMIVTGGAGVGKSAVLGRVVALSDPSFRATLTATTSWTVDDDRNNGTLPPVGGIDAAIHLRGLNTPAVARQIAEILELPPMDIVNVGRVVDQLLGVEQDRRRRIFLFDALDEAEEPRLIADQILRPLVDGGCRVVVGTRPSASTRGVDDLLGLLSERVEVDLDESDMSNQDIAEYVRTRLAENIDAYPSGSMRGAIAEAVSARAVGQFLYAKLTIDDLMSNPILSLDQLEPALTSSVGQAFGRTLDRLDREFARDFTTTERGATALAIGLAWAEGLGVPLRDHIWPVVSAAAGAGSFPLTDMHCRWFFLHAGAYVLESGDGEQAVYRLYHEALHEYLRTITPDPDAVRRSIGRALLGIITASGGWGLANPYIVRYLPQHLGSGMLDELTAVCTDPTYLARAVEVLGVDDTSRVLDRVRRTNPYGPVVAVAKAVRRSRVALTRRPDELAPQLIARLGSEADVAIRRLVANIPTIAPPIWLAPVNVRLDWSAELETTQTVTSQVHSLAVWYESPVDPVLLIGVENSVLAWDPRYGSPRRLIETDGRRPTAIAAGVVLGRQVITASFEEGATLAVYDAHTGEHVVPEISYGSIPAWSLALAPAPSDVSHEAGNRIFIDGGIFGLVLDSTGTSLYWTGIRNRLWVLNGQLAILDRTRTGLAVRVEGRATDVEFVVDELGHDMPPVVALGEHLGQLHLAIADEERAVRILTPTEPTRVVGVNFPIRSLALSWIGSDPVVLIAHEPGPMPGAAAYVSVRQLIDAAATLAPDPVYRRLVGIGEDDHGLVGFQRDGGLVDLALSKPVTRRAGDRIHLIAGVRQYFEPEPPATGATERWPDRSQFWPILSSGWAVMDGREVQLRGSLDGVVWIYDRGRNEFTFGPFLDRPAKRRIVKQGLHASEFPSLKPGDHEVRSNGRNDFDRWSIFAVCAGKIDGSWHVAAANAERVVVHDLSTGMVRPGPRVGDSRLTAMAFGSVNGQDLLATGSDGGGISIWDCSRWRRITGFTIDDPVSGIWLARSHVVVETNAMAPALFDLIGLD